MNMFTKLATVAAFAFTAMPALAQEGTVEAEMPRTMATNYRIVPVIGASSFQAANEITLDNFDDGFSAGLFVDFGDDFWNFETGILTMSSTVDRTGDTASFDVDTWGVPLLAKINFSGKPHETVFLKAGVMPFTAADGVTDFDIMAVGGIGAALPLGRNSSFLIDATYNRLFTEGGDLTDYQGISILAGLSFNI